MNKVFVGRIIKAVGAVISLVAALAIHAPSSWSAQQFYFYFMKNGNLYGSLIDSQTHLPSDFQLIRSGGWTGDLAVDNGFVYLMRNGDLLGAPLEGLNLKGDLQLINPNGWVGELSASNGFVYRIGPGPGGNINNPNDWNLYGGPISPTTASAPLINEHGFFGSLAVSDGFLYRMGPRPGEDPRVLMNWHLWACPISSRTLTPMPFK